MISDVVATFAQKFLLLPEHDASTKRSERLSGREMRRLLNKRYHYERRLCSVDVCMSDQSLITMRSLFVAIVSMRATQIFMHVKPRRDRRQPLKYVVRQRQVVS